MTRVIFDGHGQMCNRLWQYADQVAWAMKHGGKVVCLLWDPSLDDFPALRDNPYIRFPFYVKTREGGKWAALYRRALNKLVLSKSAQRLLESPFFRKRGFILGREIIFAHDYYPEVWAQEKDLFTPSDSIVENIDAHFSRFRNDDTSSIVGVHIRKGDYRRYLDGQLFYEDEEYAGFMQQVTQLLGQDTRFLLVSNEKINREHFLPFRLLDIATTTAAEDMYALSRCDYLMGPYSTFSGWASLYGGVPCYFFRRGAKMDRSDFQVVRTMTQPKNLNL